MISNECERSKKGEECVYAYKEDFTARQDKQAKKAELKLERTKEPEKGITVKLHDIGWIDVQRRRSQEKREMEEETFD